MYNVLLPKGSFIYGTPKFLTLVRREKRTKLEIFHDILEAIQIESPEGGAKPTRVQQRCNLSYDKFSRYLTELENRKLINPDSPHFITDKGKQFLQDYGKIKEFLSKMKLEYLAEGEIRNED